MVIGPAAAVADAGVAAHELGQALGVVAGEVAAAHGQDPVEDRLGLGLDLVGERLDVPAAAERVGDVDDAGLLHDHLLGAQGDLGGLLAGQRQGLVEGVGVQAVGAAEDGGERLDGGADDVVVGLLRGERDPGGLRVEAQPLGLVGLGAVDVAHPAGPDAAGRAELGDLLEEVEVAVEEERQARGELLDVEAAGQAQLDVAEAVGEGEGELLRGRRAGLADVVAGDRQRLVVRDVLGAVLHEVADQAQVRLGREQPLLLRDVLLEDVGLQRAVEDPEVDALALGGDEVHAEDRDRRAADRHRRGDVLERQLVEQHLHVGGRVDGHAAVPDLAEAHRVVGVAAHQGRHVERHREAAAAALEDHLVALVGLHRVAEAGELADRPGAAAVAGRVEPAGEGELPRPADPLGHLGAVGRAVDGLDLHLRERGEVGVPHLALGLGGVVAGLPAGGAGHASGAGGLGHARQFTRTSY